MAKQPKPEEGVTWSLNLIKPDAVKRGLIGRLVSRFEDKGLRLVGLKMVWASRELIEASYSGNAEEEWFPALVDYMTSGPVVAMVWEGPQANTAARQIIGKKLPLESVPGSIRGDFNIEPVRTVVHGSRTPEEAEREINIWFFPKEGDPKPIWDCLLGTEEDNPDAVSGGGAPENSSYPVMPSKAIHSVDPYRET